MPARVHLNPSASLADLSPMVSMSFSVHHNECYDQHLIVKGHYLLGWQVPIPPAIGD